MNFKVKLKKEELKYVKTAIVAFAAIVALTFVTIITSHSANASIPEKNEDNPRNIEISSRVYTLKINDTYDEPEISENALVIKHSSLPNKVADDGQIFYDSKASEEDELLDIDPLSNDCKLPIYERLGITEKEFNILCDVAWHEYGYGSAYGQAAVISCVLNRVESEYFPNDIESVVAQKGQFSLSYVEPPYHAPTESMLEAFEYVFSDIDYSNGGLYFATLDKLSPKTRAWFESLDLMADYGDLTFFK